MLVEDAKFVRESDHIEMSEKRTIVASPIDFPMLPKQVTNAGKAAYDRR